MHSTPSCSGLQVEVGPTFDEAPKLKCFDCHVAAKDLHIRGFFRFWCIDTVS